MFLDIGWSEMTIVLIVALIVIGPKDLPKLAREIGKWTGKARAMAREFQRSLDDMAREADLDEIKSELRKVEGHNLSRSIRDTVDPEGDLDHAFDVETGADDAKSSTAGKTGKAGKAGKAGQTGKAGQAGKVGKPGAGERAPGGELAGDMQGGPQAPAGAQDDRQGHDRQGEEVAASATAAGPDAASSERQTATRE